MPAPELNLSPDLRTGVVPVSKAASSLATLIKRSASTKRPIVITQKGYPTGVLLSVELFDELRAILAAAQGQSAPDPLPSE